MKYFIAVLSLFILLGCKNSTAIKQVTDVASEESTKKDIVGLWELIKRNWKPGEEPRIVDNGSQEYVEIKSDGTYQGWRSAGKWFIAKSDQFINDSTSKSIFITISDSHSDGYTLSDRSLEAFQVKVSFENDTKLLYLTSLKNSTTAIYVRKL